MALLLASASPQRRAILDQLRLPFRVVAPNAEELATGVPDEVVLENSRRKADAVAAERHDRELLVAVDTVVALDGVVYGKPYDRAAASDTLRLLRGRTHDVVSGLTLVGHGSSHQLVARTGVRFRDFSDDLLDRYLDSDEWRERAGGYAIQGLGAAFVAEVRGDYLNVVGFPAAAFLDLLDQRELWHTATLAPGRQAQPPTDQRR